MSAAGTKVAIDIVMVTHNSAHLVRAACRRLSSPERARLMVIDAGSSDSTLTVLQEEGIEHAAMHNRGFGAACNVGARGGTATWVAFVNPDALVTLDHLTKLATRAQELGVAAIAPMTFDQRGRTSVGNRAITPPWRRVAPKARTSTNSFSDLTEVETFSGAVMLIERRAFEEVGGFDEGFFLYAEEDDLLCRLRSRGGRVALDPSIQVLHMQGRSSEGVSDRWRAVERLRGHIRYVSKHYSRAEGAIDFARAIFQILAGRELKPRRDSLRQLFADPVAFVGKFRKA